MGLVTLILLLAFTALYLSKSLEKKPEFVTVAVAKLVDNLDMVSLYGSIYAFAAAILTLIMVYGSGDMLIRLLANIMIILMALPFIFEKITVKFQAKANPAIIEEAKSFVGWVTKQEKYVGYAGAVVSLLLFAVLFR